VLLREPIALHTESALQKETHLRTCELKCTEYLYIRLFCIVPRSELSHAEKRALNRVKNTGGPQALRH
jgi:hypothetical protein